MKNIIYEKIGLIVMLVGLLTMIGWIMNIVTLVGMNEILTGMGVARIVGIFIVPLGGILGYF